MAQAAALLVARHLPALGGDRLRERDQGRRAQRHRPRAGRAPRRGARAGARPPDRRDRRSHRGAWRHRRRHARSTRCGCRASSSPPRWCSGCPDERLDDPPRRRGDPPTPYVRRDAARRPRGARPDRAHRAAWTRSSRMGYGRRRRRGRPALQARPPGSRGPASAGSHQLRSPSSCITAGTSTIRTTVASTRIAVARPDADQLERHVRAERERPEHGDHDQRGRRDHPRRPGEALGDRLARVAAGPGTPPARARAGTPRSPSRGRTGPRT